MTRPRTKVRSAAKKPKPTRRRTTKKIKKPKVPQELHPWRLCPYGQHWVVTHSLHVPPSHKDRDGSVTTRHGHCADNPSGKDQLYPDEIGEIAEQHFRGLANQPCPLALKYPNGDKYDHYIAGWVQYWNEVFKPADRSDPNLAKALIATESRFEPRLLANKKDQNSARGLMQITNKTRKMKTPISVIVICTALIPSVSFAQVTDRLSSAKLKYPYSLIGDDFGILDEEDLAANTCTAIPEPYSVGSGSSYWRCFDSSRVMFECDSSGKADRNEGVMGIIVLKAADSGGQYEYIARHLWPISACRDFGRAFAQKKKGSSHTCISGSEPRESLDRRGRKFTSWFFEKYKTHKGCESYFEGACDLEYQIRRGCKVGRNR